MNLSLKEGGLRVRPATLQDIEPLHSLALKTGGGFTNLPMDRDGLVGRITKSCTSFETGAQGPQGQMYILVVETAQTCHVVGTASLFTKLGVEWPFYSYRRNRLSQRSLELDKILSSDVLHLVNDFDGASEVGGLFLDPAWRRGGTGRLLARSRYLFIAQARCLFADRIVADLRGYQDETGRWPFWEAVGKHFFDMPFEEADQFNSLKGNQFIADLMPKYPIYVRLLPLDAQAVIGRPHRDGEAALKLLLEEGFFSEGYIDIFDAGPTVYARTDHLRAVRESVVSKIYRIEPLEGVTPSLIAKGQGADFCATIGTLERLSLEGCAISPQAAHTLGVGVGEEVRHVLL